MKLLILAFAVGMLMQMAALCQVAPELEVSSVRPHVFVPGASTGGVRISGNRVTVGSYWLNLIIAYAFNVKGYQIYGGPAWAAGSQGGGVSYDITAKAAGEGTLTMEQARLLLQSVLADRFQLKIHREMKEMPVYALVIGKNGPKLQESAPDAKPTARFVMGPNMVETATKTTMAQFAAGLSTQIDRPVLDKTGLTAPYDYKLEWSREQQPQSADPIGPSIFTAVQEQLGLKLESQKDSVEVLVIDHAEKPSEN